MSHAVNASTSKRPSPGDSPDIAKILTQKRAQIDEEVERFRVKKAQEFRDFERALRQKGGLHDWAKGGPGSSASSTSARKSLLGLLTVTQPGNTRGKLEKRTGNDHIQNGQTAYETCNGSSLKLPAATTPGLDVSQLDGTKEKDNRLLHEEPLQDSGSLSRRVPDGAISLEHDNSVTSDEPSSANDKALSPSGKLTITTQRSSPLSSSPVSSEPVLVSSSTIPTKRIPPSSSTPLTWNQSSLSLSPPNYLHLLESKHLSLPRDSTDHSCSTNDQTTSPSRGSSQPSTSLPSAFRRRSSSISRTPKHVLFKLADTAIVEPSSSYEERPSMSSPNDGPSPLSDRLRKDGDNDASTTTRIRRSKPSQKPEGEAREKAAKKQKKQEDEIEDGVFQLDEDVDRKDGSAQVNGEDQQPPTPTSSSHSHHNEEDDEDLTVGSPAAGSLPINIVKSR